MIPERHEFLPNEVSTGIKFAIVPMLEPPIIAQIRMPAPSIRHAFPLFKFSAINREFACLKVRRLELSGEGSTSYDEVYLWPVAYRDSVVSSS